MNEIDTLKPEFTGEETEAGAQLLGSSEELVNRYTHCTYCGAHLHFSHITDFSRNLTQEMARCPECGLKARKRTHKLQ